MKTVNNVIDSIWGILTKPNPGAGKTFTRFYKLSFPDNCSDSYFGVVNCLPVPKDSIQEVELNVNVYAKDINVQSGIADLSALNSMALAVITDLHDYNNDVFDVEYSFGGIIREEALKAHYFNLRFKLIYINN